MNPCKIRNKLNQYRYGGPDPLVPQAKVATFLNAEPFLTQTPQNTGRMLRMITYNHVKVKTSLENVTKYDLSAMMEKLSNFALVLSKDSILTEKELLEYPKLNKL